MRMKWSSDAEKVLSDAAKPGLTQAADAIASTAASLSRVDTGRYRDGWTSESLDDSVKVVNRVPYALVLESRDGTVQKAAIQTVGG